MRREKFQRELVGQVYRFDMTVGKPSVVVTLRKLLYCERAKALHRDATILSFAEHVAHLIEEGRYYDLAGGNADAASLRYCQRKFIEIFFWFHVPITNYELPITVVHGLVLASVKRL